MNPLSLKRYPLLLLMFIIALSACKDEVVTDNTYDRSNCMIQSVDVAYPRTDSVLYSYELSYDDMDRLIEIKPTTSSKSLIRYSWDDNNRPDTIWDGFSVLYIIDHQQDSVRVKVIYDSQLSGFVTFHSIGPNTDSVVNSRRNGELAYYQIITYENGNPIRSVLYDNVLIDKPPFKRFETLITYTDIPFGWGMANHLNPLKMFWHPFNLNFPATMPEKYTRIDHEQNQSHDVLASYSQSESTDTVDIVSGLWGIDNARYIIHYTCNE